MKQISTATKSIIVALSIAVGVGLGYYYRSPQQPSTLPIVPFEYERDAQEVIQLFKEDYEILSTRDFDLQFVDWVIRSHSPNEYEPEYEGKMFIDVLRDEGHVAGFVTYYLRSPFVGTVLFLEIGAPYRKKGYGELLIRHGIAQLFAKGVQVAQLLTRASNFPAQRLYNRVGFTETGRDEGFVYYAITQDKITPSQPVELKAAQA